MSYDVDKTELYICHYHHEKMLDSYVIKSKKEIQDDIRRYYAKHRNLLPNQINKICIHHGEEVSLKEFVPKSEQKPIQKSIYQSSAIWNAIWNDVEYES